MSRLGKIQQNLSQSKLHGIVGCLTRHETGVSHGISLSFPASVGNQLSWCRCVGRTMMWGQLRPFGVNISVMNTAN